MIKYRSIFIFGPPGSGKGTQGKSLGTLPGFFHCACGDVFRSIDVHTELGAAFLNYSSKGLLVPDDITIKLWQDRIKSCVESCAFKPDVDLLVLDGIPRNRHQARLMDEVLVVERVFYLTGVSDDAIILRLQKRALKDNRLDDVSDAVVRHRLEIYHNESNSLLDHYPPTLITRINAMLPPHVVLSEILCSLICVELKIARVPATSLQQ
jgi:adenylate kinase